MPSTWSHLTSPPRPPFPIPLHDNVFLPITPSPFSSLRPSCSEPALNFVLKGLSVLADEQKRKGKEVKVSEAKTRRRNTLLVTPGQISRIRSLSITTQPPPQPMVNSSEPVFATQLPQPPRTPLAQTYSHFSSPSTPSSSSTNSDSDRDDDDYESDDDDCSVFSTPSFGSVGDASSPCPHDSFSDDTPISSTFPKYVAVNEWRSPLAVEPQTSTEIVSRVKRRRTSEPMSSLWEKGGISLGTDSISPRTKMKVGRLEQSLSMTSI
ncbi:hypothetical protein CI109_106141 [Kwoniella shandongensis]|uniref:Uncharacterized protein n=1 Tax=Kwoniella shandongensis TaxID=1734106 RepID=A0A5M6BY55_9TREE|nr:uncharacterized protein CI109_003748 [Kwoniella shandongensis]KAA5527777.1 hypothetical protein CI109_003748 [Kwoniella shandongensis]